MRVQVQVLAVPGAELSAPVLLVSVETNRSNKRFLVNFPEGTQRLFGQFKLRLVRVEHVLLTRLDWAHVGGLPGGILTMADAKASRVSLLGPRQLASFLESTRYFLIRPDVNFEITEFAESDERVTDDETSFVPIVLRPSDSHDGDDAMDVVESEGNEDPNANESSPSASAPYHKDVSSYETLGSHPQRYRVRLGNADSFKPAPTVSPETAAYDAPVAPSPRVGVRRSLLPLRRHYPATKPHQEVVCYAIETPTIPGSFKADVAKSLGVKGADFGLLSKGQNVTIVRGDGSSTLVTPDMVRTRDVPGPVVLVVECPSSSYVASLHVHSSFTPYYATGARPARVVYHYAPSDVFTSPEYAAWLTRFSAEAEHVALCPELVAHAPVFRASATAQVKLHHVHPRLFPALWQGNAAPPPPTTLPPRTRIARAFEKLTLVPQHLLDESEVLQPLDTSSIVRELLSRVDTASAVSASQRLLAAESDADRALTWPAKPSDPMFAFLGTGAALPSKYRNVTANYVELPGRGGLLLDCGEGSYAQLLRLYGPTRLPTLLLELRVIFVSHIHADHHLGTLRVLTARHALATKAWGAQLAAARAPVLVAPRLLHFWLSEYSEYEALHYRYVDIADCASTPHVHSELFAQELGLSALYTVPVVHCADAVGVILEHTAVTSHSQSQGLSQAQAQAQVESHVESENSWKLVFSGDTRPCESLNSAGVDCTLLIHEATFEDELQHEAVQKNHATTAEAIGAAVAMRARFVMLNHFSQRYPKIPSFDESAHPNRVGVAFDLMTFTFADFHDVPKLLPALRALFVEDEDEDDEGKDTKDKDKEPAAAGKKRKPEPPTSSSTSSSSSAITTPTSSSSSSTKNAPNRTGGDSAKKQKLKD